MIEYTMINMIGGMVFVNTLLLIYIALKIKNFVWINVMHRNKRLFNDYIWFNFIINNHVFLL